MFFFLVGTIAIVIIWKIIGGRQRVSQPWGCGYALQTPRMQYTASSYADEINSIASATLNIEKHVTPPRVIFPISSRFHSHANDFSETKFVGPVYRYILNKIHSVEFLSRTDIRFYILHMLLVVLLYGGIAIIWTYF